MNENVLVQEDKGQDMLFMLEAQHSHVNCE